MDLQGCTVKVTFPKEKDLIAAGHKNEWDNNNQPTAPAVVVTDWSPKHENVEIKYLNVKVSMDGTETLWITRMPHITQVTEPILNPVWELY